MEVDIKEQRVYQYSHWETEVMEVVRYGIR
jgi:hypothetical protein